MTSSWPRSSPKPAFTATWARRSSFCSKVRDVFGSSVMVPMDSSCLHCKILRLLCLNHSWDSLQVGYQTERAPAMQQRLHSRLLPEPDFKHQPALGLEPLAGLRDEAFIDFQA